MAIKPLKGGNKSRLFISAAEKYVSMLSDKGIQVVIGHAPATDGIRTIFLPELPENATREKVVQWMAYAQHEQAHFHGKSVPQKMSKKKFEHFCQNAVDDVRVENGQEQEYPGIRENRQEAYQYDLDEFLAKELKNATAKNLPALLPSLLKYMIFHNRVHQMGAQIDIDASDDIYNYYEDYLKKYERRLHSQKSFNDSLKLGSDIYEELYALVKDELDQQDPQQGDPQDGDGDGDPQDGDPQDGSSQGSSQDPQDKDDPQGKGDSDDSDSDDSPSGSSKGGKDSDGDNGDNNSSSSSSDEDDSEDGEGDEDSQDQDSDSSDDDEDNDAQASDSSQGDEDSDDAEEKARQREEELAKRAKELMDSLDQQDHQTPADKLKDAVDKIARGNHGKYQVANGVKDDISYNFEHPSGPDYVDAGRKLLGSAGAKMTRLFVSQTRESIDFNQMRGKFDMRAFASDYNDTRKDLYTQVRPGSLDKAAISFAIDNSDSMGGLRIQKAYAILGGILSHLDRAGIPTEAAGFTGEGSSSHVARNQPVTIKVVKTFDEPFRGKSTLRCHPSYELNITVELDCLKWLAPRLYQRPEGKKVLIVLSDGEPNVGNSTLNNKMKRAYKAYIQRLREHGFFVIGFGIECDVSEYFGEDCICTSTNNLGGEIVKKLTEILNRR